MSLNSTTTTIKNSSLNTNNNKSTTTTTPNHGKFLAGLEITIIKTSNDNDTTTGSSTTDELTTFYNLCQQILLLGVAKNEDNDTTDNNKATIIESWMNETLTSSSSEDEKEQQQQPRSTIVIPLNVLSSMRHILRSSTSSSSSKSSSGSNTSSNGTGSSSTSTSQKLQKELEHYLLVNHSSTKKQLKFDIPKPRNKTPEEIEQDNKFAKRMELLRMKAEERDYQTYTTNLGTEQQDDDVTTKSMTYAASIGLNMIVAPISFGIFIYFFASPLIFKDDSSEDDSNQPKKIHIGRVITSVISGVIMLIIEMLLFVIRSHELDTHTTKKKLKRSKEYGAFGSKIASDIHQRDFYE